MNINGLIVSVNYDDILAHSIARWVATLNSLLVVTDMRDDDTVALAEKHGASVYRTDVFYDAGATFNKGAAMEEARRTMPWQDWVLFADADIIPPADWIQRCGELRPGFLYGPLRRECPTIEDIHRNDLPYPKNDCIGVGFFQLFHVSDRHVQDVPLLETDWQHAGCYDSGFMHRWDRGQRKQLPFDVLHIGERDNWWGRGNREAFAAMIAERKNRGGYQHERIIR